MQGQDPSRTAQGAAAIRLGLERVPAPYGRAADDVALLRDLAGLDGGETGSSMVRYLQLRTTYFDQAVVQALAEGIDQVVALGAGYDGRNLRYDDGATRWFEVDQDATQLDKVARIDRLGLDRVRTAYVPADLITDDLDRALDLAGHDAGRPTLFTCEGVAGYLPVDALVSLLRTTRSRAAVGSRLAIEIPVAADTEAEVARQGEIRRTVEALGEPMPAAIARNDLADTVLAAGWEIESANDPLGTDIRASRKIPAFVSAVRAT